MTDGEKKEVLKRLTSRVSAGLLFVELDYLPRHENPDAAWIRNIYILPLTSQHLCNTSSGVW